MTTSRGRSTPESPSPAQRPAGEALPAYTIESVDRALQLLMLLPGRTELRVTEVSRELGVAPSTAHRLLSTLANRGFVTADFRTHTYKIGPSLTTLADATHMYADLPARARPHLAQLSRKVAETVSLITLEGAFCRFVSGISGERPLRTTVRTGALFPSHTVSGGKVLLAELSSKRVKAMFARQKLCPMTDRSIVSLDRLQEELAAVREQGYAINMGESEEGICAVAMPVRDAAGTAVAAVAISAAAGRLKPGQTGAVLGPLGRTVHEIGDELPAREPVGAQRGV